MNHLNEKQKTDQVPVEELLLCMSMREDIPNEANKAFADFYERYKSYLWQVCNMKYQEYFLVKSEIPEAVMNNTFYRLYKNAGDLLHIEQAPTAKDKDNILKSWLGKTASREMKKLTDEKKVFDNIHELKDDFSTFDEQNYRLQKEEDDMEIPDSTEAQILKKVLSEMTPRDLEILLTYYEFQMDIQGEGHKKLPAVEIERLCNKYHILSDYLRQIKHRTFLKIQYRIAQELSRTQPE